MPRYLSVPWKAWTPRVTQFMGCKAPPAICGALRLRYTPELRFVADDSIAYSAEISATLHKLKKENGTDGD